MQTDRNRLATLERIERVRAVERYRARAELAEAHAEDRRLSDLARRSRAMQAEYGVRANQADAHMLAASFVFRSEVGRLAQSAEELGRAAGAHSDEARANAASADHRLDHVSKRARAQRSREAASDAAQGLDLSAKLARRLQSTAQHIPRGDKT